MKKNVPSACMCIKSQMVLVIADAQPNNTV